MSFKSRWRQFVNWIDEVRASARASEEFEPDFGSPTPSSWEEGEAQAKSTEFDESKKWWVTLGYFVADYWDSKVGGEQQQATRGPVTGNVDVDALLITGVGIAALVAVWSVIRKVLS